MGPIFWYAMGALCVTGSFLLWMHILKRNKLKKIGAKIKPFDIGLHSIGLPRIITNMKLQCTVTKQHLVFMDVHRILDKILMVKINDIFVEDKSRVSQRLTATRILTLGIFSLAAPKSRKIREYCLVIDYNDDKGVNNAVFEFSGTGALEKANAAHKILRQHVTIKPNPKTKVVEVDSQSDIPAQIEKLAELKEKGILTEEEFESKKKDLLSRL